MSAELGMYQRLSGKFFKCASCGACDLKDYTGSYHMSLSLPSDPDGWILRDESVLLDRDTCAPPQESPRGTKPQAERLDEADEEMEKREQWIQAHSNFANMIQWIEPLLVATFGAADGQAICDSGLYTEGSFRTMSTGWGVPGTTDVRTFKDIGTGRYVTSGFDWLFPNATDALPNGYRESISGCIEEGMGADIRIKSKNADPLLPMNVSQGIEIRIFDNFPIEHLPQAYRFVVLVAEASRMYTVSEFIYNNMDWSSAMQEVMKEGWNAILPEGYVSGLVKALNLPEDVIHTLGTNSQAFDVFQVVYRSLWDTHADGMWTHLLLDEVPQSIPAFSNPNRESWEIGAINAGITPNSILDILGIELDEDGISRREIKMSDIKPMESHSIDGCEEDIEDLIYLAETYGMVQRISLGSRGSIDSFIMNEKDKWDERFFTSPTCGSVEIN